MKQVAFVFPGQGAQHVGMGKDFYEHTAARGVYDVFDALMVANNNAPISQLCFEGPEETLKQTLYTQPGILATSLAAYLLFKERCPSVAASVTAGHSLGEYGALFAAGVIDLQTAARLVKKRAELMEAAPNGAMSAVLGLEQQKLEGIIAQIQDEHTDGVITIANYNTPEQVVISGSPHLLELAAPLLKDAGAKRVLPLSVGGAFHSPLMNAAAEAFTHFLDDFTFQEAQEGLQVITNVDSAFTSTGEEFRQKLAQQIDHAVRWTQTMTVMRDVLHVDTVIEFGPGKVLTGMIKKFAPDIAVYNVYDLPSLEATVAAIQQELATA